MVRHLVVGDLLERYELVRDVVVGYFVVRHVLVGDLLERYELVGDVVVGYFLVGESLDRPQLGLRTTYCGPVSGD